MDLNSYNELFDGDKNTIDKKQAENGEVTKRKSIPIKREMTSVIEIIADYGIVSLIEDVEGIKT